MRSYPPCTWRFFDPQTCLINTETPFTRSCHVQDKEQQRIDEAARSGTFILGEFGRCMCGRPSEHMAMTSRLTLGAARGMRHVLCIH